MPKIFIYEAEQGDWRYDCSDDVDVTYGCYTEVTEEELRKLRKLNQHRITLNNLLRELKEDEVEYDWPD